jgi:hypothetical protein
MKQTYPAGRPLRRPVPRPDRHLRNRIWNCEKPLVRGRQSRRDRLPRVANQARPGSSRPPRIFLFPSRRSLWSVPGKIKEITRSGINRSLDQLLHRLTRCCGLVRLLPLRAIVADLPIPAPLHVAPDRSMAATQVPQAELGLADTAPPPRVDAGRQGHGALQPGGGQHYPLPLPAARIEPRGRPVGSPSANRPSASSDCTD